MSSLQSDPSLQKPFRKRKTGSALALQSGMGVLQALISFIRRSSMKVVQAIFGWAVQALFGTPRESERTLLSAVVAVSAAWPYLLIGVAFPKAAALVIAFVPLSDRVPEEAVRLVWIAL